MRERSNPITIVQKSLQVCSKGRGTIDISNDLAKVIAEIAVDTGLCHVFLHHTSASLIICENADPDVRSDLETFMASVVPDGDPMFVHTAEGPDDMPAHVRSIMTQTELTLPITGGKLALGTWQGVYLWEHRTSGHHRHITVTVHGSTRENEST